MRILNSERFEFESVLVKLLSVKPLLVNPLLVKPLQVILLSQLFSFLVSQAVLHSIPSQPPQRHLAIPHISTAIFINFPVLANDKWDFDSTD
jgi:hypothetical protein